MFVINDLDARDGLIYFEVPFTRFDVVAAWDKHQNYWLATDNGMAVAIASRVIMSPFVAGHSSEQETSCVI